MPVENKKPNKFLLLVGRHLNILVIGVMIVWCVVGYVVIIAPRLNEASSLSEQSSTLLEQELANKNEQLAKLNDLIAAYNDINQSSLTKIGEFLPSKKDVPGIFTHAEALAKVNDAALLDIQIYDVVDRDLDPIRMEKLPKGIGLIGADMQYTMPQSSRGPYYVYRDFLESVENNLRLLDIEHLSFSPSQVYLTITAKTYYLQTNE